MPTAPPNPYAGYSQERRELKVILGDAFGEPPEFGAVSGEDNSTSVRVISFKRSAGAKEPDEAILELLLAENEQRIVDSNLPTGFARQVAIYVDEPALAATSTNPYTLLWWGEIIGQRLGIDPQGGERVELVAQVRPYHFGEPLQGIVLHKPGSTERVDTDAPIVFDERIDGVIMPNRSRVEFETDALIPAKWNPWVSPESFRSTAAATFQEPANAPTTANPNPVMWRLWHAVHTLCQATNEDQEFLRNPDFQDLLQMFLGTEELKHHELDSGKQLCDLLDDLVTPYGFGWFLKPKFYFGGDTDVGLIEDTITFFKHGVGKSVYVDFPRPGDPLDPARANTDRLALLSNIGELFNVVIGKGGWIEREVTIELQRGWPADQDSLSVGMLTRSESVEALATPLAWRLWVANEAGDYCDLRNTPDVAPTSNEPIDLSSVFGDDWVPERMVMQNCLTKTPDTEEKDGRRKLPFLEYHDGSSWKPVKNWGQTLLDNQIGVYFDGDLPPDDLIALGDAARLRITGTLRNPQKRMQAKAERLDSSSNLRDSTLTLDLSDRFFNRDRQKTGTYTSQLWASDPFSVADTRNDQTALETFVEKVQSVEDAAVIQASFRLPGVHLEYEIGDLLPKVTGRNLSLNRKSPTASQKQFLQILAITVNQEEQFTELHTSSIDQIVAGYQYPLTGGETRARFKNLAPHGGVRNAP